MYKVVVVFIRKLQYSVRSPPENDEVIRFNLNVQPCQKRSPKATSFPCVMCFSTPRAPLHTSNPYIQPQWVRYVVPSCSNKIFFFHRTAFASCLSAALG